MVVDCATVRGYTRMSISLCVPLFVHLFIHLFALLPYHFTAINIWDSQRSGFILWSVSIVGSTQSGYKLFIWWVKTGGRFGHKRSVRTHHVRMGKEWVKSNNFKDQLIGRSSWLTEIRLPPPDSAHSLMTWRSTSPDSTAQMVTGHYMTWTCCTVTRYTKYCHVSYIGTRYIYMKHIAIVGV